MQRRYFNELGKIWLVARSIRRTAISLTILVSLITAAGLSLTGTGTITGQFDQGISLVEDNQLFAITYLSNSVILTSLGQAVP